MRLPITLILVTLLALGAIEGIAWWWMHPAPAGQGEPVLAYRPSGSAGVPPAVPEVRRQEETPAQSTSSIQKSKINNHQSSISSSSSPPPNLQSPISSSPSSSSPPPNLQSPISSSSTTHTPLPEIYRQAAPMLRCSSGQVFLAQPTDSLSLHLAFFEWDGTDTGSVLEAFRHMPEACMGSIGMILVEKAPARTYGVTRENQQSTIINPQSSIPPSSSSPSDLRPSTLDSTSSNHSLIFDHTIFRDPGQGGNLLVPGPLVHAFRAVWVSGLSGADARQGLSGEQFDRLRSIRFKSALNRFRPEHARVIQGAVRGAANGDAAWKAFEENMLADLRMDR